jgi:hypothetical protein
MLKFSVIDGIYGYKIEEPQYKSKVHRFVNNLNSLSFRCMLLKQVKYVKQSCSSLYDLSSH